VEAPGGGLPPPLPPVLHTVVGWGRATVTRRSSAAFAVAVAAADVGVGWGGELVALPVIVVSLAGRWAGPVWGMQSGVGRDLQADGGV